MDHVQRQALKERVQIDLRLLIHASWQIDVMDALEKVLDDLEKIQLEGYDD